MVNFILNNRFLLVFVTPFFLGCLSIFSFQLCGRGHPYDDRPLCRVCVSQSDQEAGRSLDFPDVRVLALYYPWEGRFRSAPHSGV